MFRPWEDDLSEGDGESLFAKHKRGFSLLLLAFFSTFGKDGGLEWKTMIDDHQVLTNQKLLLGPLPDCYS